MGELVDLMEARARLRPTHRDYPPRRGELGERPYGSTLRLVHLGRLPWLEEPPEAWNPYASACIQCGQAFEGLELRIGRARFHGRRGACRAAALAILSAEERDLAEEARRSRLWPHPVAEPQSIIALDQRGVPIRDELGVPVLTVAQATFPARRS